jgi:hypothetical protein
MSHPRASPRSIACAAVARIADRAVVTIEAEGQAFELRLDVLGMANRDSPATAIDRVAGMNLFHAGSRASTRRLPPARGEYVEAALVLESRMDIRSVDALFAEQQLAHARDWRRSVHRQLRHSTCALVPSLEHQAPVVHAMVVVKMAEERVGHIHRAPPAFEQPVMRARSMIHDDDVAADFEEIARALSLERRIGRPGSEQCDLHDPEP